MASSGVARARSLAASRGSSAVDWNSEKWPSAVKIMMPLGLAPKGSPRVPLSLWLTTDTKVQAPTIPSLTEVACAQALNGAKRVTKRNAARLGCRMAVAPSRTHEAYAMSDRYGNSLLVAPARALRSRQRRGFPFPGENTRSRGMTAFRPLPVSQGWASLVRFQES